MKRKLLTILTILSTSIFTSCGNNQAGEDESFKPALDVNTSCTLTVVGDYGNFGALEDEIDRFNKYYPNVELNYEKLDKYNSTLATALDRTTNRPNIFFSYTWMIGNKDYKSVVDHMEELSNKDLKLNLDCLRPELINKNDDGKILMVPVFSRTYGTLVNNDLFEKEGLSVPTKWSDLLSTCASLKAKGYASPMMGYSKRASNSFMNTIAYPAVLAALANNQEALDLANKLDNRAGEYLRSGLTAVHKLITDGCIDLKECDKLADDYAEVIKRFLNGDVPMMICAADTPSGMKSTKYYPQSFIDNPFNYSFCPIPLTEEGGYYVDSPAREFSVNKDCENLDMTNEFMRFLISNSELNNMAAKKGLLAPTKTVSFESMYAPFGNVPANRMYFPEVLDITDDLAKQIRLAAFKVGTSTSENPYTIEDAIRDFGTLE